LFTTSFFSRDGRIQASESAIAGSAVTVWLPLKLSPRNAGAGDCVLAVVGW